MTTTEEQNDQLVSQLVSANLTTPALTLVPTPAPTVADIDADWADENATLEILTLPRSGKRVQVRPVSLLSMIASDQLPNDLLAVAQRSAGVSGSAPSATPEEQEKLARDGVKLIDLMVCEMCVRPTFVNKPQSACGPGERSVQSLWDSDKTWLFTMATRGQAALKSNS